MQARQRMCLLAAILLALGLLCELPSRSLHPEPTSAADSGLIAAPAPAQPMLRRPLGAAFEAIRRGMAEEDLFALMAPYEKSFTGHHQWQVWADGDAEVHVTIWPEGGLASPGPFRVQSMHMQKSGHRPARWLLNNRVVGAIPE